MRASRCSWLWVSLLLEGCAGLNIWPVTPSPAIAPKVADTSLTPSQVTAYMGEVSRLDAVALNAEIKRLRAGAQRSVGDRLKLAYLLGRESSAPRELARARGLLEGLPDRFDDPGTRELARLLQRMVKLEQDLLQERRKASELQGKIDQLMSLEQTLERHRPSKVQGAP
jgi:hypothetical protein